MSNESVLLRLEAEGQPAPRVRLRAIDDVVQRAERRTGRYEILGELASGGVGQVLKGRDVDLGRDVALKVLRDRHLDNPELMRRLVEEAQIAGQLHHPGIVPVYELGLQEGRRPFIAMKLIKGRTLAELLAERGDAVQDGRRLLRVFEHVCRAVAYAHARGVVHRDLKPSNVMVGAFGEVQVLDWGFAKVLARGGIADERKPKQPDLTVIATLRSERVGSDSVAGSIMGTPAYMSPEQALGHVDQLDERSDVFSLGAILCEILTGDPPYVGERVMEDAAQARLDDAHRRLGACDADPVLVDLARSCLAPLRADRPRHGGRIAETLAEHLTSIDKRAHRAELAAAEARTETERAKETAAQQRRARWQGLLLAGCILFAALAAGGSYAWVEGGARDRAARAEASVATALQEAERLCGLRHWVEARRAAEQAVGLADADRVAESTRRRAREMLDGIAREEEVARRDADRRRADAQLIEDVAEARLRWSDEFDHRRTDATFTKAFRAWGLDVDDTEEDGRAVRDRGLAFPIEVAAALADWAWLRRVLMHRERREWEPLIALADRVDPDPAHRRLRRAVADEDLAGLREVARSVDRQRHSPHSLALLAVALQRAGERESADEFLRALHRKHPDDLWVLYHMGLVLTERRPAEAAAFLTAALAQRSGSVQIRDRLAYALQRAGKRDEAIRLWREASRLDPSNGHVLSQIAFVHRIRGFLDLSAAVAREAVERQPDSYYARYQLASVLAGSGDVRGGEEQYRASIRLAEQQRPKGQLFEGAPWDLAAVLAMRGEMEEALATMRPIAEDDVMAAVWLGNAVEREGDLVHALEAHRIAVQRGPTHAFANFRLGQSLMRSGRFAEALPHLRRAEESASRLPAWDQPSRAWIARCERMVTLDPEFDVLVRNPPREARTCLVLAQMCAYRDRPGDAVSLYRRAFERDPELAENLDTNDRFDAACAAISASARSSADQATCGEYRAQALAWLTEQLRRRREQALQDPMGAVTGLWWWELRPGLTAVRDERQLSRLPPAEHRAWRELWTRREHEFAHARARVR